MNFKTANIQTIFARIFRHFCGNVTLVINGKVAFSKFYEILTVILSTLHLNCTVHAAIFNFTTLIKLLISHTIELLVNMKMHLSVWDINFVYLLLILDSTFFIIVQQSQISR